MNSRWKVISIVGVILVLLSAFHLHQTITLQHNHLQEFIALEKNSQLNLAENIQKHIYTQYVKRIESFTSTKKKIIEAFARRDRERLLELCRPYYEIFKKENRDFFIFHFVLPDNRTFLRVHYPELYGDDLSAIRPILTEVNRVHERRTGFEGGKLGVFYRVTQPVFFEGDYIGVLEFGIKMDQFTTALAQSYSHDIALLVKKDEFAKAVLLEPVKHKTCGEYVLFPKQGSFFNKISDSTHLDHDCSRDAPPLLLEDRYYHVDKDLELLNFQGAPIGRIAIAFDVTPHILKSKEIVRVSVITSLLLLLLALVVLYFSFGTLLARIFALNSRLKELNANLENTVSERTADLEHEITERKQACLDLEEEIRRRREVEKKLAEEKELLAVTLRSIGDGVISTDIRGRIVHINKNAEKLTGWSQNEAAGRPLDEVFHLINSQSGSPHDNPVTEILETGRMMALPPHTVLLTRDGGQREIDDSGAPIYNRDSNIIGVIFVFRDVTGQKKLEEELLKVQKLEAVGILAGGIAHDFNNILAAILGNINLAARITGPDHEVHEMLVSAEKASLRARDLTQQLLTFAKGGAPVKETASIVELVRDSANFITSGSKVKCLFDFAPELFAVEIDRGQMSQVIQNIILNACQAMEDGGTITIRVTNLDREASRTLSLPSHRYLQIVISDTGKGIEQKDLDRIFDPYFTTKKRGSHKGSGLGLAIVHSIIKQHGGFIRVASELGRGTTFTIFLKAGTTAPPIEEQIISESLFKGSGKILIMDDEEIVLNVAQIMLVHMGYEVSQARDGEEMLDIYRQEMETGTPFDAVIIDLTIPGGMGGEKAIKELLALDPSARAVVSSGYSNDPIMANYADYGFKGFLTKPFQVAELGMKLRQIIGDRC